MSESVRYRVGVDIGGTFTDIVVLSMDGSVRTRKVSSTPEDYGVGIIAGITEILDEAGIAPANIDGVVHATTVATNTILEFKGARTALMTTRGFRDLLEMRRLRIPELYNLQYEKPPPLVPRRLSCEIGERLGPNGEVWEELDEETVRRGAEKVRAAGAEALAICLLHSYANPEHEYRVRDIVRAATGNDIYITCSADILPEIREYERASTTVVNAYIGPVIAKYLGSLSGQLRDIGIDAPLQVMQSSGGVMAAEAAIEKPAYIVESGPAAGVIACARIAGKTGHGNVISLDMGGTTAKTALIENGVPGKTTEYEIGAGINLSSRLIKGGGYPIKLPFIDVSEIGAGGGSIVSVDGEGRIAVGPRSAGAEPGPVCYDTGGADPTLTDVLLALGYLNPRQLLGGTVKLNAAKALTAIEARVADPLKKSLLEAAYGVYRIAGASMTRAVKAVSTYRGRDPRDFTLFAFGGNGPVAAVEIARALQMRRVLVPPAPGVFSALGLLFSDTEYQFTKTLVTAASGLSVQTIEEAYRGLESEAAAALSRERLSSSTTEISRYADMRYSGQAYELTVPVAAGAPDVGRMIADFGAEHQRTYGHRADDDPVELVAVKVVARAVAEGPRSYDPAAVIEVSGSFDDGMREAYFGAEHGLIETPVVSRGALIGRNVEGPLIVEEYDATCIVPPGSRATLDDLGNIDIEVGIAS